MRPILAIILVRIAVSPPATHNWPAVVSSLREIISATWLALPPRSSVSIPISTFTTDSVAKL